MNLKNLPLFQRGELPPLTKGGREEFCTDYYETVDNFLITGTKLERKVFC